MTQRGKGSPDQIGCVVVDGPHPDSHHAPSAQTALEQLELHPQPEKSEAKIRILSVLHPHVVTWAGSLGVEPPSVRIWTDLQEMLTYINAEGRWDDPGGRPRSLTKEQISNGAWRSTKRKKLPSVRTIERYSRTLQRLLFLTYDDLGEGRGRYVVRHRELDEARGLSPATVHRQSTDSRLTERRSVGGAVADECRSAVADDYIPSPPRPTSTTNNDRSDWPAVVVVEVRRCGIKERNAPRAVAEARQLGATPDQIRAIVVAWRDRRAGWQWAIEILWGRLTAFDPQLAPTDDWPPFDDAYQAKLDLERRAAERRTAVERQHAERAERERTRDAARAEHERDPDAIVRLFEVACPEIGRHLRRTRMQLEERPTSDDAPQPRPP